MAYSRELADRLRSLLAGEPVVERHMFGGVAFLVDGNMSVAAGSDGGLLVRVDPAATDTLLEEPGTGEFAMSRRPPMRGWLVVRGEVLDDEDVLRSWVARGLAYARTLPKR